MGAARDLKPSLSSYRMGPLDQVARPHEELDLIPSALPCTVLTDL